jgi:hypothetical protein
MGYDMRDKKNLSSWIHTFTPQMPFAPALTSIAQTDSQFAQVENAAIKMLNANANVGVQANMAQNLAQYRQTTNMLANSARRIAGSMFALRKGQFSRAANILVEGRPDNTLIRKGLPSRSKALANNWLELQYGWKPLLSDVEQSMKGLANYMAGSSSTQKVKGVATKIDQTTTPYTGVWPVTPYIGSSLTQNMWQCRFGCEYKVTSHMASYLSQLGFTNPINLVWEILPYSFVVDWFIPIGPYLESMSAPHGLTFVRGYKTRFGRRYTYQRSAFKGTMPGDSSADHNIGQERDRMSVTLARTKLSAWPVQSFPTFKNPFSTTHVANALALVRQAFGRRR